MRCRLGTRLPCMQESRFATFGLADLSVPNYLSPLHSVQFASWAIVNFTDDAQPPVVAPSGRPPSARYASHDSLNSLGFLSDTLRLFVTVDAIYLLHNP